MKKAFSMILAIFFIILVASIGALSLSMANAGAKTSANLYLREQAKLLGDSAIEYAVLKVQQNDFSTTCVDEIEIKYPSSDNPLLVAKLKLTYIGDEAKLAKCSNVIAGSGALEAVKIEGRVANENKIDTTDGKGKPTQRQLEKISYSFSSIQKP